jgi:hypothetical protein
MIILLAADFDTGPRLYGGEKIKRRGNAQWTKWKGGREDHWRCCNERSRTPDD